MRFSFDLLAPFYDRVVGAFLGKVDPDLWMELLRLPAERLLDAGGGTGRVSAELRRLVRQSVVCDVSHGMLRRARDRNGLQTVRGDVLRLPFADASFDRIIVTDSLHHFPRQKEAVGELLRVLTPGGRMVVEDFDARRLLVKGLALGEKALFMGSRFLSPEEIRCMLQDGGARVEIRKKDHFSFWIIAEKI